MLDVTRPESRRFRHNTLLLMLVICCIFAIVSFYAFSSQRRLEQYAHFTVEQNADRIRQDVDMYIDSAFSSIQLTAYQAMKQMTAPTLTDPAAILDPLLERTPFNFIEYIDQDGINATDKGASFDASDREYFQQGIQGRTGIWINYTPRYSNEYLLNFYTPLYYEDMIAGVLTGTLGADTNVLPLLSSSFFDEPMIGILCDQDLRLISATFDFENGTTFFDVLDSYGIPADGQQTFREHIV